MNMHKLTLATALLATLAFSGAALADNGDLGTPAIDYSLSVLDGGTYTLSEQTGQVSIMFVIGYA